MQNVAITSLAPYMLRRSFPATRGDYPCEIGAVPDERLEAVTLSCMDQPSGIASPYTGYVPLHLRGQPIVRTRVIPLVAATSATPAK